MRARKQHMFYMARVYRLECKFELFLIIVSSCMEQYYNNYNKSASDDSSHRLCLCCRLHADMQTANAETVVYKFNTQRA